MRPLLVAPEMPSTSPRRTVKLTSAKSSPERSLTSSATAALCGKLPPGRVGEAEMRLLPGHRLDQPVLGQVGDRARNDVAGVAQHGHRLADLVDLLQVMRDEQEGHALRLQLAHAPEQALDLVAVELGGRFVEDDEAGAVGEGAGDLDQLARLDLEVAGARVFRHRDVPAVEELARLPAKRRPADQAALGRLAVDEEVLGDGELGNDRRMLVDAGDLLPPGLAIGDRRRRLAGEADLAGVRRAKAGQDADQRRFAGAVAADQRMRLAGQHA